MESVYDAKRLADSGHSAQEIKARLELSAYDASIYLSVNSLEYLKDNGHRQHIDAQLLSGFHCDAAVCVCYNCCFHNK